jgi:uncharacterized protein
MPLAQEQPDFRFVPRGVDAGGRVTINDTRFDASFIVSGDQLLEGWRPRNVADLQPSDLDALFGTGTRHAFPAPAVLAAALTRGIGFEPMVNSAAARTFAVLAGEGRKVVAAFLIDPGG